MMDQIRFHRDKDTAGMVLMNNGIYISLYKFCSLTPMNNIAHLELDLKHNPAGKSVAFFITTAWQKQD
jgi:hypothetical protein